MRKQTVAIILCLTTALAAAVSAQETANSLAATRHPGDSLTLTAITAPVMTRMPATTGHATEQGFQLQRSAGLDAPSLRLQLSRPAPLLQFNYNNVNLEQYAPMQAMHPHGFTPDDTPQYNFTNRGYSSTSQSGIIHRWDSGYLEGGNGLMTMPLLGSMRTAEASVTQHFGERWTLTGGISLQKYAVPHGAYNTFAANALATYTLTRNVSFSAFTAYQSGAFFSNYPSAATVNFGGYATLLTNNQRWGVDLGAQGYKQLGYGPTAVVPIVRPFYMLGGQKLGIDFGPMIYNAIHSASHRVNGGAGFGNPSIMPNLPRISDATLGHPSSYFQKGYQPRR